MGRDPNDLWANENVVQIVMMTVDPDARLGGRYFLEQEDMQVAMSRGRLMIVTPLLNASCQGDVHRYPFPVLAGRGWDLTGLLRSFSNYQLRPGFLPAFPRCSFPLYHGVSAG